ncbi:MAG: DNA topoisomerase IV subunit A [Betaproteobacteria bacterium]|nr:DNA topoisomerase IV subunit A [Betaproteobacteria bacterium]MDH3437893.1 DNA topoisomerase IV subunit A [Betaproteobacteria bacterium]
MAMFAERSYLTYAMSVVRGRAIPNVEDGEKPVQRRILYAMHELGLRSGVQHSKSARIVGEVLGKYHPHGDASTYDALVRMAQDFSLRYPLIDGQGNFGTQDGDAAAAYRYTEARLTPIANLLLSEIDQDTVDFRPNYDGRLKEPEILPARLPMLLLNGASGVAVGMACELPPHNMREVAEAAVQLLRHPKTTPKALMDIIQGPDFPGGSQVISSRQAIMEAYTTGRGSLRARCRWKVENLARGQWQVAIYELPPTTSAKRVMSEIEELTNPKVKERGGKVSAAQTNLKQLILGVLEKVNDESDKASRTRLVLEPRSSRQDPDEFMRVMLSHTSLEENFSVNLVALGLDGRPGRKNIHQLLEEWVQFRVATVTRRTKFRLSQVERRLHILEGRRIVFLNIDKVIKLIRASDEPKPALMKQFKLTDVQAEDILEIRLRQLARLEGIKIESELKELKGERKDLKALLGSDAEMKKLVAKEIRDDAKQYGDNRRTMIEEAGRATFERQVVDEPLTVIVSRNGWVRSRQGHELDLSGVTYKTGDGPYAIIETRSVHYLALIDSTGRAFSVQAAELPGSRGDGVPLTSLVDLAPGARFAHAVDAQPGRRYLVANSAGYGYIVKAEELLSRVRAGKAFMTVPEGAGVLRPALVPEKPEMAVAFSEQGRMLLFPASELKELARGRGITLMGLDKGEKMVAVGFADSTSVTVIGKSRTDKERTVTVSGENLQKHILHRARKGCLLPGKMTPIGVKQ